MSKAAKKACMKKGGKVQPIAAKGLTRREDMDKNHTPVKKYEKGGAVSVSSTSGVCRGMGAAKRGGNYSA